MPQRFLRPGIRTSPRWNAVSHRAARLYIAILTLVDDYGRYDGRPSVLWADAFAVWNDQNPPQDAVNPPQVAADCAQLAASRLVEFYEVSGRTYLQVTQWQERMRGVSKWPSRSPQLDSKLPQVAASCREILPPSSSSSTATATAPTTTTVPPSPLADRQDQNGGIEDVRWLLSELGKLYRRKPSDRPSNLEESTAAELVRERGDLIRLQTRIVVAYHGGLNYKDRKFFPGSLSRLLSTWNEVLDKARMADTEDPQEAEARFQKQLERSLKLPHEINQVDAIEENPPRKNRMFGD